jgi:hypothetical protein
LLEGDTAVDLLSASLLSVGYCWDIIWILFGYFWDIFGYCWVVFYIIGIFLDNVGILLLFL